MSSELKVTLVTHTPNPVEVCSRAAGISYDKEEREDDAKFIKCIVAKGHESVIEHVKFTFKIEGISRACSHQLVRHRLASYTQRSQRYVDEGAVNYIMPKLDNVEDQARVKDDYMSPDFRSHRDRALERMQKSIERSFHDYAVLRQLGVKAEDARFVLPNACETKIVMTANARELRHIFKLRLHETAQWEIRNLAKELFDMCMTIAPVFFEDLQVLRDTGKEGE